MQVLKEEIRERILLAATEEFGSHGYHATSMRSIAKKADVTPGNVYAYFKNKEDLLDAILHPVLTQLLHLVEQVHAGDRIETVSFDELASEITNMYMQTQQEFMMLMTKAHGTKYASAKKEIIQKISLRLMADLFPSFPHGASDPILALTIASALVEGLLTIFRNVEGEVRVHELVYQLMYVMFHPMAHALTSQGK